MAAGRSGASIHRYGLLIIGALAVSAFFLGPRATHVIALPERFYGMTGESINDSEPDWEAMQKAGVQKFRMQVKWQTINEAGGGGSFGWKNEWAWHNTYDHYFEKAAKHGIAILPYIYTRKDGNQAYFLVGGTGYAEWLEFVWTVVQRYGQAGSFWFKHLSLPQYPVDTWEVWNEPNLSANCPSGACNGKQYGEFLVGTAKTIHQAQEAFGYVPKILFGGLYQETWNYPIKSYIEAAAKAPGIKTAYDGLSLHPYAIGQASEPLRSYPDKAAGIPSNISGTHEAQANAALPGGGQLGVHPIWITEVGWPVDEGVNSQTSSRVQTVDEGEQAGLLNATYNWVKANYSTYSIKYLAWYDYNDLDEPAWPYHSGLRNMDGDFRQAWYAYEGQTGAAPWPPSYRYMLGTGTGFGNFIWNSTNLTNFFQPMMTAVGDINGDGKVDIVSQEKDASGAYDYVRGISNGSGGFAWSGTNLVNMSAAVKMDVGDVSGDGKADIVAVERDNGGWEGSPFFRYMLGMSTGSGSFNWNFTNLQGYFRPVAMALGDINGDGKADIVSVEKEGTTGTTYTYVRGISNGTGGFAWEGTGLKGMKYPSKMSLGDINGDGKADIVAAERQADGSYSYVRGLSNGAGGFAWQGAGLNGMRQPVKMSLGDINGDGRADIVAVEKEPTPAGLYVYVRGISNGLGGFEWAGTNLTTMGHSQKMDVGDVNGDGKADIVSVEH